MQMWAPLAAAAAAPHSDTYTQQRHPLYDEARGVNRHPQLNPYSSIEPHRRRSPATCKHAQRERRGRVRHDTHCEAPLAAVVVVRPSPTHIPHTHTLLGGRHSR